MVLETVVESHTLQAAGLIACTFNPDPLQWTALISLVTVSGIAAMSTGVGAVAIIQSIIALLAAGATIDATISTLSIQIPVLAGSSELLISLVTTIFSLLGCSE